MKKIDATGLLCPQPVMKLTRAIKETEKGSIEISVDNEAAKENVTRSAVDRGCTVKSIDQNGEIFTITVEKA